jgi:hypothetical protein
MRLNKNFECLPQKKTEIFVHFSGVNICTLSNLFTFSIYGSDLMLGKALQHR